MLDSRDSDIRMAAKVSTHMRRESDESWVVYMISLVIRSRTKKGNGNVYCTLFAGSILANVSESINGVGKNMRLGGLP